MGFNQKIEDLERFEKRGIGLWVLVKGEYGNNEFKYRCQ